MASEGDLSPVDVVLTTDVGRLQRAKDMGLGPLILIYWMADPQNLQDSEGYWYALTMRARPVMYHPGRVDLRSSLGCLNWRIRNGKGICIRSSGNIYNQSMVSAMIYKFGEQGAGWANDLVKNFARPPKGGDRDQIKAAVAGQCDVAIANTYYLGGMMADTNSANSEIASQLKVFWPDQNDSGAHVNISGAAIAKHAPNKDFAVKLIEFLASDSAQEWYAENNHEYPVVEGVKVSDLLQDFGDFKAEDVPVIK